MTLSKKEKLVLVEFLEELSLYQGNQVCNDWNFPDDWSREEQIKLVKEFHDYNGDPQEFNEKYLNIHDYAVVGLLAHKLREEIEKE
jgi:hypothetical protein